MRLCILKCRASLLYWDYVITANIQSALALKMATYGKKVWSR